MNQKRAFSLLKKIGFTRYGGSKEEADCAQILCEEIKSVGLVPEIETFSVNTQTIHEQKLFADGVEYTAIGYGNSGNTGKDGMTAPFAYMEGFDDIDKIGLEGKIVLVNGYMNLTSYQAVVSSGAVGFITFCGDVLDKKSESDLMLRELRQPLKDVKVLPGVNIRAVDAMRLVKQNPKFVTIVLKQDEFQCDSRNVVCHIKGKTDEEIVFTAHYDSVYFSKGVYDNGAGSVIQMELLRHFANTTPLRSLTFIWCGSEERGLLGSKAYVAKHHDQLGNTLLCINTDVGAPVLGREKVTVTADDSLTQYVKYLAQETGYASTITQDIYSSDSIPFADAGVPGINFMRFGVNGTSHIHDRNDTMFFLSAEALGKTGEFVEKFADKMVEAVKFPVPRVIPTNIADKVAKYLNKKPQ